MFSLVVMIVPPVIAMGTADYLAPIVHLNPSMAGAGVMLLATLAGLLDLRANAWITGVFLVLEVIAAAVVAVLGFTHSQRGVGSLTSMQVAGSGGHTDTVTAMLVVSGARDRPLHHPGLLDRGLPLRGTGEPASQRRAYGPGHPRHLDRDHPGPGRRDHHGRLGPVHSTGGDISSMVTAWSNSAVGTFVSLCVALAIINAGIVMVIQNSRVLFASARDKAWPEPINQSLSRLGRFGSPWVATLLVGVPGALLCFVNLDTLYGVTGVSVTAMYLLVAVAALLAGVASTATPRPGACRCGPRRPCS